MAMTTSTNNASKEKEICAGLVTEFMQKRGKMFSAESMEWLHQPQNMRVFYMYVTDYRPKKLQKEMRTLEERLLKADSLYRMRGPSKVRPEVQSENIARLQEDFNKITDEQRALDYLVKYIVELAEHSGMRLS